MHASASRSGPSTTRSRAIVAARSARRGVPAAATSRVASETSRSRVLAPHHASSMSPAGSWNIAASAVTPSLLWVTDAMAAVKVSAAALMDAGRTSGSEPLAREPARQRSCSTRSTSG